MNEIIDVCEQLWKLGKETDKEDFTTLHDKSTEIIKFIFAASARVGMFCQKCIRWIHDPHCIGHGCKEGQNVSYTGQNGKQTCVICGKEENDENAMDAHVAGHSLRQLMAAGLFAEFHPDLKWTVQTRSDAKR